MEREMDQQGGGGAAAAAASATSPTAAAPGGKETKVTAAATAAADKEQAVNFDKKKYGLDHFKFAKFSGLRSPSSFAAGSLMFKSKVPSIFHNSALTAPLCE